MSPAATSVALRERWAAAALGNAVMTAASEAKQQASGQRDVLPLVTHHRPPLHHDAVAVHDRLAELELEVLLGRCGRAPVLADRVPAHGGRAEGARAIHGVLGEQ